MTSPRDPNFRVVSQPAGGDPVRCTFCAREMKHVIALPLAPEPWLCAYCVLALAHALASAEAKSP